MNDDRDRTFLITTLSEGCRNVRLGTEDTRTEFPVTSEKWWVFGLPTEILCLVPRRRRVLGGKSGSHFRFPGPTGRSRTCWDYRSRVRGTTQWDAVGDTTETTRSLGGSYGARERENDKGRQTFCQERRVLQKESTGVSSE